MAQLLNAEKEDKEDSGGGGAAGGAEAAEAATGSALHQFLENVPATPARAVVRPASAGMQSLRRPREKTLPAPGNR